MGILSKPFGSSSDIKKQLEAAYVPMFQSIMGMPFSHAKNTFYDLYELALNEAKKDGTINFPNLGDVLLERESTHPGTKAMLDKRRKDGVRDEDIRWWMNRHELDRRMMLKFDETSRLALYTRLREEDHYPAEKAAKEVKKFFPIFGDSDDTSTSTRDDKPLPAELKDRINIYIQKRALSDPQDYKKDVEQSSSFNALVRKEIKNGKI